MGMEQIGLIGGVSWVSTMEYYRRLNLIAQAAGRHNSARIVMYSLNFSEILKCQKSGDEEGEFNILLHAATELERSGATKLLICSNTTSNTCDRLARQLSIPVINIIDATVSTIKRMGFNKVGLLGTKYVMERGFYIERFRKEGLSIVLPNERHRAAVHDAIYDDLCLHNFSEKASLAVSSAIDDLIDQDVEAVILGCTELPLIVECIAPQPSIELIDSIDVHIAAALRLHPSGRALEA
jgi:aspartate racemase